MKIRCLVILTAISFLGFSVSILAAPPVKCDPWPQCKNDDGGSDGGNSQLIGVHEDLSLGDPTAPLWAPTDALSTCLMQKNSGKSLGGAFPRHDLCAALPGDNASAILRDDIIVIVHTSNRGVVMGVEVQGQDYIGSVGLVHVTDLMVPAAVDTSPDGSMVIHVHADNVNLFECDTHVLKKQSICDKQVGTFALDDLVYSPAP
jgi:hypothetical protein